MSSYLERCLIQYFKRPWLGLDLGGSPLDSLPPESTAYDLCYFHVFQYLGCIEVFESRGIHVCEEAVKALKAVSINISIALFPT